MRAWSVRTEAALSPRTARAGNGIVKSNAAARILVHVLRWHSGKLIRFTVSKPALRLRSTYYKTHFAQDCCGRGTARGCGLPDILYQFES